MVEKLLDLATKVRTPLALGGLIAATFFLIARQALSKVPVVKPSSAPGLLRHIVDRFFVLALVGSGLGFAAYVVRLPTPPKPVVPAPKQVRIEGKVRRNSGDRAPVPFARVMVDDKHISIDADKTGDFSFTAPISAGELLLFQVSAENYKPFREWKPSNQFVTVLLDPIH